MSLAQEKIYTIDDIYALPEGHRAELIEGPIITRINTYAKNKHIKIHDKRTNVFHGQIHTTNKFL